MIGLEWVAENATNVRFPQGPNQWPSRDRCGRSKGRYDRVFPGHAGSE